MTFSRALATALLGALVLPGAQGARTNLGMALEAGGPSDESPALRVFGVSYNAGNAVFKRGNPLSSELMSDLTAGHEAAGAEADLVILGLQEYTDPSFRIAGETKRTLLWQNLSKARVEEVEKEILEHAEAPAEVVSTKKSLELALEDFHQTMERQLTLFRKEFGAEGADFHRRLAETSPATPLALDSRRMADEMGDAVNSELAMHTERLNKTEREPLMTFANSSRALSELAQGFPSNESIQQAIAPVRQWIKETTEKINAIRKRLPNLRLTQAGEETWSGFLKDLDNIDDFEKEVKESSQHHQTAFKSNVAELQRELTVRVKTQENRISAKLIKDINTISDGVQALSNDLTEVVEDNKLESSIAEAAANGAREWEKRLVTVLEEWGNATHVSLKELIRKVPCNLDQAYVDVKLSTARFDSGWRCAAGFHYDTMMYAYANPWSDWKVSDVAYSSKTCKEGKGAQGCNIDNNNNWECGKSVNLLVFLAEHAASNKSVRFCAMNTHMSFKGQAKARLRMIKAAMDEAKAAGCEATMFMGDFNTRLHCEPDEAQEEVPGALAYYSREDPKTNSSLRHFVEKFCEGGKKPCTLLPERKYVDELSQMLDRKQVRCYEKHKVKGAQKASWYSAHPKVEEPKQKYKLVELDNPLYEAGLFEAGEVDFAPTYKLLPPGKAQKYSKEWVHCPEGEPSCFVNKDHKGKHNPAWTDRILLHSDPQVATLRTGFYERRAVHPRFHSDHLPVVASVEVRPAA